MAATTEETTTASTNDNNVATPDEATKPASQGDESSAANANGINNPNADQGADSDKVSENVEEEQAKISNGDEETNGNTEEASSNENDIADDTTDQEKTKPAESPTSYKTVTGILAKVKNNPDMADSDKVDTLCVLLEKIIDENTTLKTDLVAMNDHISKASQGNDALKKLNAAYKEQIKLVQEETDLKIQEEAVKRGEIAKSYQSTMNELSSLLETHTDHNSRLRNENVGMADKLQQLCSDGEEREKLIVSRLKEYELQIELLGHQVMKAQLEKSEIKADMTKERIELAQELGLERERGNNLTETVRILKEQAEIYQSQLEDLGTGTGNNTKTFQHFKSQIDKMSKQLVELDKDTHQWREKYEVSSQQVKKMNSQSMEREKEIGQLKKKLDQMVKLNRTLAEERVKLSDQLKELKSQSS